MTAPGRPIAASGALLVTPDGRYLLQHRDDKPTIWFPGYWGLFGGALEDGESAVEGLWRELTEELELPRRQERYLCDLSFDVGDPRGHVYGRHFFEVPIAATEVPRLRLHEGQGFRLFTPDEVRAEPLLVPYDAFGLFMHFARDSWTRMVPDSTDDGSATPAPALRSD